MLGKEHPDTLAAMSNLAEILKRQGKYIEAEGLNQVVLKEGEMVMGIDHSFTVAAVRDLAHLFDDQDQYEKASSSFGPKHPVTVECSDLYTAMPERQNKSMGNP